MNKGVEHSEELIKSRIIKQYLFALRDNDPNVRYLGLEGLEKYIDLVDVKNIVDVLDDTDKFVRWKAIKVLRAYDISITKIHLEKCLASSDPISRALAARSLAFSGSQQALEVLIQAYKKEATPKIKQVIVRNLAFFKEIPYDFWYKIAKDSDVGVRIDAVLAIGNFTFDEKLCDLLVNMLETEINNQVFASILLSLGKFKKENLIPYFQHSLLHKEPRIRANAVEALGNYPFAKIEPIILPYLNDPSNRVKANVIGLYLKNGLLNKVVKNLHQMVTSYNRLERASAAWLIGNFKIKEMLSYVMRLLNDEDETVSQRAAWSIGRLNDANVFELLLKEWNAAKEWAIPAFLSAFRKTANINNSHLLVKLLEKERNSRVKSTIIDILAEIGAFVHKPLVEKYVKDPELRVKISAIIFLAKMGGEEAHKMLLEYLNDPSPRIRKICAKTLLEKGDFRALKPLASLITEQEKQEEILKWLYTRHQPQNKED